MRGRILSKITDEMVAAAGSFTLGRMSGDGMSRQVIVCKHCGDWDDDTAYITHKPTCKLHRKAEPPEPKIEVTREMEQAGIEAHNLTLDECRAGKHIVWAVAFVNATYRAMERVRLREAKAQEGASLGSLYYQRFVPGQAGYVRDERCGPRRKDDK